MPQVEVGDVTPAVTVVASGPQSLVPPEDAVYQPLKV